MVLKLEGASESPESLLKPASLSEVLIYWVWGWAQGFVFLTSSRVMMMLLVQRLHFENECHRQNLRIVSCWRMVTKVYLTCQEHRGLLTVFRDNLFFDSSIVCKMFSIFFLEKELKQQKNTFFFYPLKKSKELDPENKCFCAPFSSFYYAVQMT